MTQMGSSGHLQCASQGMKALKDAARKHSGWKIQFVSVIGKQREGKSTLMKLL